MLGIGYCSARANEVFVCWVSICRYLGTYINHGLCWEVEDCIQGSPDGLCALITRYNTICIGICTKIPPIYVTYLHTRSPAPSDIMQSVQLALVALAVAVQ